MYMAEGAINLAYPHKPGQDTEFSVYAVQKGTLSPPPYTPRDSTYHELDEGYMTPVPDYENVT